MSTPQNDPSLDWQFFDVEPTGAGGGCCDCCGSETKRFWGFIHCDNATVAAYFVAWSERQPEHGARFDLILGKWGDSTSNQDRYAVALNFRVVEGVPQFMIVDAEKRVDSDNELASSALKRSEIIGTSLAQQVFALVDAIYDGDPRLEEIRTWV